MAEAPTIFFNALLRPVFIALFTASLTSLATYSSIPRIFARSDTEAFSSDLGVKLLLSRSSLQNVYFQLSLLNNNFPTSQPSIYSICDMEKNKVLDDRKKCYFRKAS
jgi:hypothetical protein